MAIRKRALSRHESTVGRVYEELKKRAISFNLRPGERLNEVAIAQELGVSRTPIRAALNILAADGFLTFSPKQGYFRRPLDVKEISDLYELRLHIEMGAAKLCCERATEEAIARIEDFLDRHAEELPDRPADDSVALDEEFHEQIIQLADNAQLWRTLQNVNSHIRYVRWIELEDRRDPTRPDHRTILQALKRRDPEQTRECLRRHIERQIDQITDAVKTSYARIYMMDENP